MPAVGQVHAQHGIARLDQGEIHGQVGRSAAVGLYVGMVCLEELAGPVPGDVFHYVHTLTTAIIALAGVAFGVFVGQHSAHRCQHGRADDVFRRDQLDVAALAIVFALNRIAHLGIELLD